MVLTVNRRYLTGQQMQWTVFREARGLSVTVNRRLADAPWKENENAAGLEDIAEVLRRFPEAGTLALGQITEFNVEESEIELPVLVSMLKVDVAGGPEEPDDWPEETAREWTDSDDRLNTWIRQFEWFSRWAQANDIRISAVDPFPPSGTDIQPVLADEDEEDVIAIRELARSAWHSESGGAPISWSGGHTLILIAPGLALNSPYGDSLEDGDFGDAFLRLPKEPVDLGESVADWVIGTESDVAAALALEPLDPNGELTDEERETWAEYLREVTVRFKVDIPADAERYLRQSLLGRSELYRRTREGLRSPRSEHGRALCSALDTAVVDGIVGVLTSGDWEH